MNPRPLLLAPSLALLIAADAPPIQPGEWTITSKPVELTVPGVPGFLLGMAKKTRTEKRCLSPAQAQQGIAALIAPKKAKTCTLESRDVAAATVRQVYACRAKDGRVVRATLTGRYDASSFAGRFEMAGDTAKGAMRVVVDQSARRTADAACKG